MHRREDKRSYYKYITQNSINTHSVFHIPYSKQDLQQQQQQQQQKQQQQNETSEFLSYHDSMPRRLCGGHSSLRAPTPDELDFLTSTTVMTNLLAPKLVSSSSSSLLSTSSSTAVPIVPIAVTTQVVAGTVYQVKYKWTIASDTSNNDNDNGNDNNIDQKKTMIRYFHAKIYKPLPCHPEKDVALMSFQDDCTVEAPFHF